MRAILGIIGGIVAGLVATILVGIVGVGATMTGSPDIDTGNPNAVLEAFANMPMASQLALMGAWFAGGLAGAATAKAIARRAWAAWTVAALIAVYVLLNMMVLPLPAWMQALSIAAPLIGGLIGNHLVAGAAAATAEPLEGDEGGEGGEAGNG